MKRILLCLIFLSCSETKFREIPLTPEKEAVTPAIQRDWSEYSELIDVMVAFLWPEKIETESQRLGIETVINTSRELKVKKEQYLERKILLRDVFEQNQCPCALNGECSGEEEDMDEMKCYEIEEEIYANDRSLVDIFGLVEKMKENVLAMGGLWLDTHLDLREIPSAKIDFTNMNVSFSALGSYKEQDVLFPISYEIKAVPIIQEQNFQRMSFSFPRKVFLANSLHSYGDWRIDVGVSQTNASLMFQGELYWDYAGQTRKGVIYWENPHL